MALFKCRKVTHETEPRTQFCGWGSGSRWAGGSNFEEVLDGKIFGVGWQNFFSRMAWKNIWGKWGVKIVLAWGGTFCWDEVAKIGYGAVWFGGRVAKKKIGRWHDKNILGWLTTFFGVG